MPRQAKIELKLALLEMELANYRKDLPRNSMINLIKKAYEAGDRLHQNAPQARKPHLRWPADASDRAAADYLPLAS